MQQYNMFPGYRFQILVLTLLISFLISSASGQGEYPDVRVTGAMKNVMWKGELQGVIKPDTITPKQGLYGLGPLSYLSGEIMVIDGECFISKVISEREMSVEVSPEASAPFFVYANVTEWTEHELPDDVKSIKELESHIHQLTKEYKRPLAFKLEGSVTEAMIHIQNLPPGTEVSSPSEAHQGQTNYRITDESVDIIGFFSTEHQGIFTHHDSFLHLHLITTDRTKMGHLDDVTFNEMKLYLPLK